MTPDLTGTELAREFWERHRDATPRGLAAEIEDWLRGRGESPDDAPHWRTLHEWKRKLKAGEGVNVRRDYKALLKRLLGYEVRDTLSVPDANGEGEGAA